MASTSKPTETSDLPKTEEEEFSTGPFKILTESVKCAEKILINCRNNKKLFARVTYFDRHCNMTLLDVKEMWLEMPRTSKGQKGKPVARDKYIRAMILRGDSVILIVRRPNMF